MYEYIPPKNTKNTTNIIMGLLLCGVSIMLITSVTSLPFKWVFQIISLALIAAAIYFMTRYISRSFVYRVEQNGEGVDFTVTELQRKSRITVCRLSASGIEELSAFEPAQKQEEREFVKKLKSRGTHRFDYTCSLESQKTFWVCANECGEEVAVRLAYDEELFGILSSYRAENPAGEGEKL